MEQSLADLVKHGHVAAEDALAKANYPEEFRNLAHLA